MRRLPTATRLLLALVLPLLLGGCLDVEERWRFDEEGGGTWRLEVRWNADILRRAGDALGDRAMAKLAEPPFPLTKAAWRGLLASAPGLAIDTLEEEIENGGWRRLTVAVRFRRLADLFALEILAGRRARVQAVEEDGERICRLEMGVLRAVPVLDPVAAILRAEASGADRAEGEEPADPPLLGRYGLRRPDAERVWQLVGPRLQEARIRFVVEVPGDLTRVGDAPQQGGETSATFDFDFAALQRAETKRQIALAWRVGRIDTPPAVDNAGADAAPEAAAPEKR